MSTKLLSGYLMFTLLELCFLFIHPFLKFLIPFLLLCMFSFQRIIFCIKLEKQKIYDLNLYSTQFEKYMTQCLDQSRQLYPNTESQNTQQNIKHCLSTLCKPTIHGFQKEIIQFVIHPTKVATPTTWMLC